MQKSKNISKELLVPSFERMLYQICEENGISLQFLSQNWIKRLEKSGKVRYVAGYKFDLNSQGTSILADDKFATYEILNFAKVPVIQHALLYEITNHLEHAAGRNSLEYIAEYFYKWGKQMVIKANSGTCGDQVFKITNLDQLVTVLPKVFKQSASASMCPFYEIEKEYRIVLLDGEEKLSYTKIRTASTKFNLAQGAQSEAIPEDKHMRILELAQRAAKVINLRFGSVDIIETTDGEFLILEVNSGVMARHFLEQHPERVDQVKRMYAEAVRKMFAEK